MDRRIVSSRLVGCVAAFVGGWLLGSRSQVRLANAGFLSPRYVTIVPAFGSIVGSFEIGLGEAVETRAAEEDLARNFGRNAGVVQHPCRHFGKARVEVR